MVSGLRVNPIPPNANIHTLYSAHILFSSAHTLYSAHILYSAHTLYSVPDLKFHMLLGKCGAICSGLLS